MSTLGIPLAFRYLLVFKNYMAVRALLGLPAAVVPNTWLLPTLERAIFGCLPHRVWGQFASFSLDVLAAVPYLVHFVLPVAFALCGWVGSTRCSRSPAWGL
jgi:hypothetical protein